MTKEYVVKKENTGEGIRVRARSHFGALRTVLGTCRYRLLSKVDRHERWEIREDVNQYQAVYVVSEHHETI